MIPCKIKFQRLMGNQQRQCRSLTLFLSLMNGKKTHRKRTLLKLDIVQSKLQTTLIQNKGEEAACIKKIFQSKSLKLVQTIGLKCRGTFKLYINCIVANLT